MSNVPPGWPTGRPLAVSVSVMLEGWAAPDAPGIGPMGNPLKPGTVDLQARSWAEYGAKVGAWRLLDLLDQQGVRAVFYTSGVVAEHYPDLAASIGVDRSPVEPSDFRFLNRDLKSTPAVPSSTEGE